MASLAHNERKLMHYNTTMSQLHTKLSNSFRRLLTMVPLFVLRERWQRRIGFVRMRSRLESRSNFLHSPRWYLHTSRARLNAWHKADFTHVDFSLTYRKMKEYIKQHSLNGLNTSFICLLV